MARRRALLPAIKLPSAPASVQPRNTRTTRTVDRWRRPLLRPPFVCFVWFVVTSDAVPVVTGLQGTVVVSLQGLCLPGSARWRVGQTADEAYPRTAPVGGGACPTKPLRKDVTDPSWGQAMVGRGPPYGHRLVWTGCGRRDRSGVGSGFGGPRPTLRVAKPSVAGFHPTGSPKRVAVGRGSIQSADGRRRLRA